MSDNQPELFGSEPEPATEATAAVSVADDIITEGMARAIYMTHQKPPAPTWENASEAVQNWVRAQAQAAVAYLRSL